jgi:hypothetical protein
VRAPAGVTCRVLADQASTPAAAFQAVNAKFS